MDKYQRTLIKTGIALIALSFVGLVWTVSTMGGRLGMGFFFACMIGGQLAFYLYSFSEDHKPH